MIKQRARNTINHRGIRMALVAAGIATSLAVSSLPAQAAGIVVGDGAQTDTTNTDNYVNSFLKKQYEAGFRNAMATGSWWGDVALPQKNQQWVVVRDHQLGKVFPVGTPITSEFTCLYPGKSPNSGYSPNTLAFKSMRLQLGSGSAYYLHPGDNPPAVLEQFSKLYVNVPSTTTTPTSIELRSDCLGATTELDPAIGTKENQNTNFDATIYYGAKTKAVNHLGLKNLDGTAVTEDLVDVHAWYNGTNYVYGVLKNTLELMNKPLSGIVKVIGYAVKLDNKATIHHVGVKYENGDNEDRWIEQDVHAPMDAPIPSGYSQNCVAAQPGADVSVGKYCPISIPVDTTKLSDGVHILSWHIHSIENTAVTGLTSHTGKQLAAEIKFPICVDNHSSGACK